jgi:hypothetical protein
MKLPPDSAVRRYRYIGTLQEKEMRSGVLVYRSFFSSIEAYKIVRKATGW